MHTVKTTVDDKKKEIFDLSIVVPVYNGEQYIHSKLESLLEIEDINYELIFAINKSSDNSQELLETLCKEKPNTTLIIHHTFVSGGRNFKVGVQAAKGKNIFVSAVDDICDKKFYKEALDILGKNPLACAIAPKTQFESDSKGSNQITFELRGSVKERLRTLTQNIRVSHGIYYSLIRREVALNLYEDYENDFMIVGGDWLFNLKLAMAGEVLRTKAKCIYGGKGLSKSSNALWKPTDTWLKKVLPYKDLIMKILILCRRQENSVKVLLWKFSLGLAKGNIHRHFFYLKNSLAPMRK